MPKLMEIVFRTTRPARQVNRTPRLLARSPALPMEQQVPPVRLRLTSPRAILRNDQDDGTGLGGDRASVSCWRWIAARTRSGARYQRGHHPQPGQGSGLAAGPHGTSAHRHPPEDFTHHSRTDRSEPDLREDAQVVADVSDKRAGVVVAQIARLEVWEQITGRLRQSLVETEVTTDNQAEFSRSLNAGVDAELKLIKAERQAYGIDESNGEEPYEDRLARLLAD